MYSGEDITLSAGTYTGSIGNRTNIVDGYIRKDNADYKTVFDSTHDTNTFTINEPFTFNRFYIYFSNNKTFNNQIIKPELSLGTLVKPYAPHNEYNIGSISIEKCNKNLFDSTIEQGTFDYNTGENNSSDTRVRTDYFRIKPNTQYTFSCNAILGNFTAVYKEENGTIVPGFSSSSENKYFTFTTPANAYYMKFRIGTTTYPKTASTNYDFQLELRRNTYNLYSTRKSNIPYIYTKPI